MPNELQGLLVMVGLFLLHRGWRAYTVDNYRNKLFGLRDEAWMVAARSSGLSDPDYRALRREVNGQIRSADCVTDAVILLILISSLRSPKQAAQSPPSGWTLSFHDRSIDILASHMVVLAPLALGFMLARSVVRRVRVYDLLSRLIGPLIAGREESLSRGHGGRGFFGGLAAR